VIGNAKGDNALIRGIPGGAMNRRSLLTSCLGCWAALSTGISLQAQTVEAIPALSLEFRAGFDDDGRPSDAWQRALRHFHEADAIARIAADRYPLTTEQSAWRELILARMPAWEARSADLIWPFGDIPFPARVYVLIGNVSANDAFVAEDDTIAFDVSRLHEVYGDAATAENFDRINRFFDHEFTHVLHRSWQRHHALEPESPLEQALWASLKEGVGNYRSFTARWVAADGSLTGRAEQTLERLSPIFVERLTALESATAEEAVELTRGLSMGPFDQKWGALPVGLWLVQEMASDPRALAYWVDQGPWGVLDLARKYLPAELAAGLPIRKVPSDVH